MIETIASLMAAVFSGLSFFWLIFLRISEFWSNRMLLVINPRCRVPNSKDGIFFVFLSFINMSSAPISIIDIKIESESGVWINKDYLDGFLFEKPIEIIETDRLYGKVVKDYKIESNTVPFNIDPYSSFNGRFAFHASRQSSFAMQNQSVSMRIATSRKSYTVVIDFGCINFRDYYYADDGRVTQFCPPKRISMRKALLLTLSRKLKMLWKKFSVLFHRRAK